MIHPNQTVDEGNYLRFVTNAANLPHDFLTAHAARISLAYKMGETPEMIAEELRLRYSLRRPPPTKTPRALAARVGAGMMGINWQNNGHYIREWCNLLGVKPATNY